MNKKFVIILLGTIILSKNLFGLFDDTRSRLRRAGIGGPVRIEDVENLKKESREKQRELDEKVKKLEDADIRLAVGDIISRNKELMTRRKEKSQKAMRDLQKELNIPDDSLDEIKLNLVWLKKHYVIVDKLIEQKVKIIEASKKDLDLVDEENYMKEIDKVFNKFKEDQQKIEKSTEKDVAKVSEGPKKSEPHHSLKPITSLHSSKEYLSDREKAYKSMQKEEAGKIGTIWGQITGISARDKKRLFDAYKKDVEIIEGGLFKKATLFERWKLDNNKAIKDGALSIPDKNFVDMLNRASKICSDARQKLIDEAKEINAQLDIQNTSATIYVAPVEQSPAAQEQQSPAQPAPSDIRIPGRTSFGESEQGEEMQEITPPPAG